VTPARKARPVAPARKARPVAPARVEKPAPPAALDWAGVIALVLCGLLCGLLEALLVPLYAGTVVVPVAVVLAIGSNIALPRLVWALVPRTGIAALPFLAWLLVVIGFGSLTRPEGDVILPGGGPGGVVWVTYGMLLLGAVAGAGTLFAMANPPAPRAGGPAGGPGSRDGRARGGGRRDVSR